MRPARLRAAKARSRRSQSVEVGQKKEEEPGKFNNDAFIIGNTGGGVTVPVARDRNGDGRYSKAELASAISSSEIRLHRGNASTTSSAGCFNVKDYDGFLASVGGRDVTFGLTGVEDRPR
jgi:hypothetical protein